jgi:hypothetical protein
VAKAENRTDDLKIIWADLCNTVAEGSAPAQSLPGRRFAGGKEETLRAFADECLESAPGSEPLLDEDVHAAHERWCARRKVEALSRMALVEGLALILPGVSVIRPQRRDRRNHPRPRPAYLHGIRLKD